MIPHSRLGTTAAADDSLALIRATRQRLAATVRSAILELDRYGEKAFPNNRQPMFRHEQDCLQDALGSLLKPAPLPPPDRNDPLRDLEPLERSLGLAK